MMVMMMKKKLAVSWSRGWVYYDGDNDQNDEENGDKGAKRPEVAMNP